MVVKKQKRGVRDKFGKRHSQRGYALLMLLLFVSLLAIAATAAAPGIAFEIRRDREAELVHRGVQYSRAIRRYAKRTGRFPMRLEDLTDTGGQRFIRRLYKDPITGGDFRLLHSSDIQSFGSSPNLNPPAGQADATNGTANDGAAAAVPDPQTAANLANASKEVLSNDGSRGVIFGVVSSSKAQTIREFNHKNHYNDWLFFYDPNYDRGTEIKGPTSPTLATATLQPQAGATNLPQGQGQQPQATQPQSTPPPEMQPEPQQQ